MPSMTLRSSMESPDCIAFVPSKHDGILLGIASENVTDNRNTHALTQMHL